MTKSMVDERIAQDMWALLTYWSLRNVELILQVDFSDSFDDLISWAWWIDIWSTLCKIALKWTQKDLTDD